MPIDEELVYYCDGEPEVYPEGGNFHVIDRCNGRVLIHRVFSHADYVAAINSGIRLLTMTPAEVTPIKSRRRGKKPPD